MNWRENLSRSKEVLSAYGRQGLHELGSVFYGPGTAAQHAEYGMLGTRPPGLVTEGLRPDRMSDASHNHDEAPSIVTDRLRQAEVWRDAPGREPPQAERE